MKKVPVFVQKRRGNWQTLRNGLSNLDEKVILPYYEGNARPSWFGFPITVRDGIDREKIVRYIEDKGVQTRMLFSGNLIKHSCFDQLRGTDAYLVVGALDNTDRIMRDTFWAGVYPGMTDAMLEYMIQTIKKAVDI